MTRRRRQLNLIPRARRRSPSWRRRVRFNREERRVLALGALGLLVVLWVVSLFQSPPDTRPRWPDGTVDARSATEIDRDIMSAIEKQHKEYAQRVCDARRNSVEYTMEIRMGGTNLTDILCAQVEKEKGFVLSKDKVVDPYVTIPSRNR